MPACTCLTWVYRSGFERLKRLAISRSGFTRGWAVCCTVYRPGKRRLARAQRVSWLSPEYTHTHRPDSNVPQLSPVTTGHYARRTERESSTSYAIPVHIGPGPGPGSLTTPSAEEGHSMFQVSKPEDSLRRPTAVFQLQQDWSELHQAPCPRRRKVGHAIPTPFSAWRDKACLGQGEECQCGAGGS